MHFIVQLFDDLLTSFLIAYAIMTIFCHHEEETE